MALYLVDAADHLAPRSLSRHLFGIADHYHKAGLLFDTHHPLLRQILSGIYRLNGRPLMQKNPLHWIDLCRALEHIPHNLAGYRDKTLLLIGYLGAFRHSELAALRVEDLTFSAEKLRLTIRSAKMIRAAPVNTSGSTVSRQHPNFARAPC